MEHSTSPKPKLAEASFADVRMATPKAERQRPARALLMWGLATGLLLGVPLGAIAIYLLAPSLLSRQVIVLEPAPVARAPTLTSDLATATAASTPDLAPARVAAAAPLAPKPAAAPVAVVAKPAAKPAPAPKPKVAARSDVESDEAELQLSSKPPGAQVTVDGVVRGKTPLSVSVAEGAHELKLDKERYATVTQSVQAPAKLDVTLRRPPATLHVDSDPPGGDVLVEGKPRGKTPVDVTLEAFHHYDVQVTLLGTHPWRKRVSLKPPQTDVTAKLSVVHAP
jgi:hypothetical protein